MVPCETGVQPLLGLTLRLPLQRPPLAVRRPAIPTGCHVLSPELDSVSADLSSGTHQESGSQRFGTSDGRPIQRLRRLGERAGRPRYCGEARDGGRVRDAYVRGVKPGNRRLGNRRLGNRTTGWSQRESRAWSTTTSSSPTSPSTRRRTTYTQPSRGLARLSPSSARPTPCCCSHRRTDARPPHEDARIYVSQLAVIRLFTVEGVGRSGASVPG
jgi:hypothetical protein